jgi:uncharacterized membrane protein YhiD involved in acid resistance
MDQITFADVLQKSFIAMSMGSTDRITTLNILINVVMSFLVGMFIFYIYRKTYQGVLYQRSFNISLVLASVVTSLVIMTISGNLILSLGMVGALSIVRFRTPIKDSMDLIFLFWAISVGISNGVGYFNISIVGSILIALILIFLTRKKLEVDGAFIAVFNIPENDKLDDVLSFIRQNTEFFNTKSKVISDNGIELTIEMRINKEQEGRFQEIQANGWVSRITIVAYEQDISAV